jgi:hypothetical protein
MILRLISPEWKGVFDGLVNSELAQHVSDVPVSIFSGFRMEELGNVRLSEFLSARVVHAIDDRPFCLEFNSKDYPVGEINEMADFEGEFVLLRN